MDPLFWECILENAFLLEYIIENTLSRMHFAENNTFDKILIIYKKWFCWKELCLVDMLKNAFFLLNNILLVYIM